MAPARTPWEVVTSLIATRRGKRALPGDARLRPPFLPHMRERGGPEALGGRQTLP